MLPASSWSFLLHLLRDHERRPPLPLEERVRLLVVGHRLRLRVVGEPPAAETRRDVGEVDEGRAPVALLDVGVRLAVRADGVDEVLLVLRVREAAALLDDELADARHLLRPRE